MGLLDHIPARPSLLPPAGLPAHLTKLGAPVHTVQVHWKLENTERLVIGPEPLLVLAARARRDVELLTLRIDYPKMGDKDMAGQYAEAVLVHVPHATGKRKLRPGPELEQWVWGQENIPAAAMFESDRPEERITLPDQVRWWGGTVACIEYNKNPAPCIWWCWRGRVAIPRGTSVGVIVRASAPTLCEAMLAGV